MGAILALYQEEFKNDGTRAAGGSVRLVGSPRESSEIETSRRLKPAAQIPGSQVGNLSLVRESLLAPPKAGFRSRVRPRRKGFLHEWVRDRNLAPDVDLRKKSTKKSGIVL